MKWKEKNKIAGEEKSQKSIRREKNENKSANRKLQFEKRVVRSLVFFILFYFILISIWNEFQFNCSLPMLIIIIIIVIGRRFAVIRLLVLSIELCGGNR